LASVMAFASTAEARGGRSERSGRAR